jgi:hypothetical protein
MRGLSRVRSARSALDVVGEQFLAAVVEKALGTGRWFQSQPTWFLIEQEADCRAKSLYLVPERTLVATGPQSGSKSMVSCSVSSPTVIAASSRCDGVNSPQCGAWVLRVRWP